MLIIFIIQNIIKYFRDFLFLSLFSMILQTIYGFNFFLIINIETIGFFNDFIIKIFFFIFLILYRLYLIIRDDPTYYFNTI